MSELQHKTPIPPMRPLRGMVRLPGSKSITNRALLLAALARGTTRLTGALKSGDTVYMAHALRAMGVTIDEPDETSFIVSGTGRLTMPAAPLFIGNAGTAARFLTAAAVTVNGTVVIDGNEHMRRRPIRPLVAALQTLGVEIADTDGCLPVTVRGRGGFSGRSVQVDGELSSQYLSALLMLGACADDVMRIRLRDPGIGAQGYVGLTVGLMTHFGASVRLDAQGSWCVDPTGYQAVDLAIEPDASAATYMWAAEALTGGQIDIGMSSAAFIQPDAQAFRLISLFPHLPSVIDGSQMQDAVPTLAVLAAFNRTPVCFTGISNLRVKECDRIMALADGLDRIAPGLAAVSGDELTVAGASALGGSRPCRIDTVSDHRIAMSFALAGLRLGGISILEPSCVSKTYPGYWDDLSSLGVLFETSGQSDRVIP